MELYFKFTEEVNLNASPIITHSRCKAQLFYICDNTVLSLVIQRIANLDPQSINLESINMLLHPYWDHFDKNFAITSHTLTTKLPVWNFSKFSPSEDELLALGIKKLGRNWAAVSVKDLISVNEF